MSLQALILSLLSGIDDPATRTDIATTIAYLKDLYLTGVLGEDQLRNELFNVIDTVLEDKHPELLPDERIKRVNSLVDQFVRAIKLETMRARMITRFGMRSLPT